MVTQVVSTGEGWCDCLVRNDFLKFDAEMRVFGEEFAESPETRKSLQRFVQHLAGIAHPSVRAVLDSDDASKWTAGSEYVVFERSIFPPLDSVSRETPLDTRERILPFLQCLAGMLIDFQGHRLGPDRLSLRDVAWDGLGLIAHGIAWATLMEGFVGRRLPALSHSWEKEFSTGLYPLGERPYPRLDALVRVGHLAYGAAGVSNADKRILDAAQVSSADTSASAPPLVEGWGLAVEAVVRRCLFAHQTTTLSTPDALLEAIEKLMAGEIPEVAQALPTLTVSSVTTRAAERELEPELPVEEEREISTSAGAHTPTRTFTPLGAEAAMLDMPAKAGKKKVVVRKGPRAPRTRTPMAAETKSLLIKVAGAVALAVVVILAGMLVFGSRTQPNSAPSASIASLPSEVKAIQPLTLDGSGSADPEGDALTYEWGISGLGPMDYQLEPNNSPAAVRPTVRFFKPGTFTLTLRVFDGKLYSPPVSTPVRVVD